MDTERGWIHCHSPADYFCRYNTGKLRRICDECFTINNDIIVEVLTEEEYEIALIMEE